MRRKVVLSGLRPGRRERNGERTSFIKGNSAVTCAAALVLLAAVLAGCARTQPMPQAAVPVTSTNNVSTNPAPASLEIFMRVPPPSLLGPESESGQAVAKAQELLRQGQTNAAVELLQKAVKDPACDTHRPMLIRKCIALLLYCGRVEQAQATYLESAAGDEDAARMSVSLINGYLIKNGRGEAAAQWAARLETLPLRGLAAEENLAQHLQALAVSGNIESAIKRLPEIAARTNEVQNINLMGAVETFLIRRCEFDKAERFLVAIEQVAGGRNAYTEMVTSLRMNLESARTHASSPAPGDGP